MLQNGAIPPIVDRGRVISGASHAGTPQSYPLIVENSAVHAQVFHRDGQKTHRSGDFAFGWGLAGD